MTYQEFEEVFKMLISERDKRDEFLNQLPSSINSAFFDNEMVESLHKVIDKLCEKLFTPNLLQDVDYFLYDYEFGWKFMVNYKEYEFKTVDDILEYFKECYFTEPDATPVIVNCESTPNGNNFFYDMVKDIINKQDDGC